VEHNTEWLAEYAQRIVGIDAGGIAFDGEPETVLSEGKAKKMGLKIPCAVQLSHDLGLGFAAATPKKLAELLRGKK
jgi:energy-coupling factor transporter ATP-binding protein EcfA2